MLNGLNATTLEDGSVVLEHTLTGSKIVFTMKGDIQLLASRTNVIGTDKVCSVVLGVAEEDLEEIIARYQEEEVWPEDLLTLQQLSPQDVVDHTGVVCRSVLVPQE